MSDLAYLDATSALELFRHRKLSPVDLMQAVISRAQATEPAVNALPRRYFDQALVVARQAEARWVRVEARPLDGLPVAIKDSTDVEGQPTSLGSLSVSDQPATRSSVMNARVLAAGGVPHARSATPEFSCAHYTHSRLSGDHAQSLAARHNAGRIVGGRGRRACGGKRDACHRIGHRGLDPAARGLQRSGGI